MVFSCLIYLVVIKLIKESAINLFILGLSTKQKITIHISISSISISVSISIYMLTFVFTVPGYPL